MKTIYLSVMMLVLSPLLFSQGTGLTENFQDNVLTGWTATPDYQLTERNGELLIDAQKRSTWNSFTFSFAALDITANPYVSLKVKAETDVNLGFSIWDNSDAYVYPKVIYQEIVASSYYAEYLFDFSNLKDIDLSKIRMLNFVFNPGGAMNYSGGVYFDDLRIGDQAHVVPSMTQIPVQSHYINSSEMTVLMRNITDALQGPLPLAISAKSSNPALVPNPAVLYTPGSSSGKLTYTPSANVSGTAQITVTLSGNAPAAKEVFFDVVIEKNNSPHIDPIPDQNAQAGEQKEIVLTGVNDGNANAQQSLSFSAVSANPDIIPNPVIQYIQGEPTASLIVNPAAGQSGVVAITVTAIDDGGTLDGGSDIYTSVFQIHVYDNVNDSPTLDPIENLSILEGSGEQTVLLSGISDGDPDQEQTLTITVTSSNTTIIPQPVIVVANPSDINASLKFTPAPGHTGDVTIKVTVSDDGGAATNNGDQSIERSFIVNVRPRPTIGFEDEYADGVLAPHWPAQWGDPGEDTHRCSESGGVMRIEIDKTRTNNQWAGLWYNITNELDLSQFPYISITMKTSKPGTKMLIFLWDAFDHYNTGGTVTQTVTGEFKEYFFDFTGLNLQGDGTVVDFSRIKALLINFDPGVSTPLFKGDFYFDDFRVGTFAHRAPVTPVAIMNPVADFVIPQNSGAQTINLTGISDGATGINPVTISAKSNKASVIPNPTINPVVNGQATLTYQPAQDKTGQATITLTVSATGSKDLLVKFDIDVVAVDPASAVQVDVDILTEHQVIDGFGAFMGTGSRALSEVQLHFAKDIGMTMARFGIIDGEFEPFNDNSDPNIIDFKSFNKNAVPLETMRLLKKYSDVQKYIMTWWSPPAWMKRNKCLSAEGWSTDNKLEPYNYEEYAEHVVALIKTVKYETGIDLYAVSLQNEPQFNEPYPSCQVTPNEMRDLIRVVGPRLEAEGLQTKIFWAEALPAQQTIDEYIFAVKNDPIAGQYADIVATHNYDTDGIHVGGPGAQEWARIYDWAQNPEPALPTWMTETSGHADTWDGAMELAGNLYNALGYGNISAWCYWSFSVDQGSAEFGLVVDNLETSKYNVSKQYYKFIRPGAVRVDVSSTDPDVPCLAFKNYGEKSAAMVLINKSASPKVVRINGSGLPLYLDSYTTSENRNCEKGATMTLGSVILLPASSVTTLIGYDPISVEEKGDTVSPTVFKLFQNFPNPFNPTTTIEFQVPRTSEVSVRIYDVLGREVAVLIDNIHQPGYYTLRWDGLDTKGCKVATGLYFYRMVSPDYVAVKKCMLLK